MVERLKTAIEKARERRNAGGGGGATPTRSALVAREDRTAWAALRPAQIDAARLPSRRVVNFERNASANHPFDVLRTRLLKACADNGWRRIGVTSPTRGCGKTMLSANLAFSFARRDATYAIVADLDLRAPKLSSTLGLRDKARLTEFLDGAVDHEMALTRVGENLAFLLNDYATPDASERLQNATATQALSAMIDALAPTIVLYDLPPMLLGDETMSFLDQLDAVLLVAAAGQTTAEEITECDRLIAGAAPLVGVVLNKCDEEGPESYPYD